MTDVRHAISSLRGTPGFTAVALVVLTLGIGASTAIFSVVDAVVLRGLPFDEHDRLVALGERVERGEAGAASPRDADALSGIAPQNYVDWALQQRVFESIAAIAVDAFTLRQPGVAPEDLYATRATAGFFDVLRIRPAFGRAFTADHEVEGRHRVVILSDALWRDRFGGDPAVLGRFLTLDDGDYEVIGVMPPGVTYPMGAATPPAFYAPYVVPANERIRRPGSRRTYLHGIARLKPGVSIALAQSDMDRVAAAIQAANPVWNRGSGIGVRALHDHLVGATTRSWMLMLLGAVGVVLLIACANVANLLLARSATREREMAVRSALGASRWRLVRQLMVESLVLSIAGALAATLLAWWGVDALRSAMPDGVPRTSAIAVDVRVLAAAAALSVATGLLCGIVPAAQSSRLDLSRSLKDGTNGAGGGRRGQRLRAAFVVAEVALAVVLLVGAALFIGSFVALMRVDPGLDPERVLTARIAPFTGPANAAPHSAAAPVARFEEIVDRLRRIPGVVHASVVFGGIPLSNSSSITSFRVPGRIVENDNGISVRLVTPDYHRALGIAVKSGRLFDRADRAGATDVVLINEAAVRKYFPGTDPIGRTVTLNADSRVVVGVVGDVHQRSLETTPREEAYAPVAQKVSETGGLEFWTSAGDLVIRTSGHPYDVLPAVRSAVFAVFPDVPLRGVWTMEERFAALIAGRRLHMLLLGFFGLLGLVISAVGIYGAMACMVSQRTREIGVRMALGATRTTVVGTVLAHAGALVAAGLAIGSLSAWLLGASARAFLFGLEANDARAFAAALLTVALSALLASVIPARRAASVDPVVALRAD
jgi:predicted permease